MPGSSFLSAAQPRSPPGGPGRGHHLHADLGSGAHQKSKEEVLKGQRQHFAAHEQLCVHRGQARDEAIQDEKQQSQWSDVQGHGARGSC